MGNTLARIVLLSLFACADSPARVATGTDTAASVSGDVVECPAGASVMDGWDDRAPPRRVYGNTYFVGTCGISAVLVTSSQGHVLLDGGTEAAGPAIAANIEALGFKLADIKFILNSHEHSDHAGGLAHLQHVTGAPVLAFTPSAISLRRGASDQDDPQFSVLDGFPPVAEVRLLSNDHTVRVGDLALTAHATPGHAPGSTSWTWISCEASHCQNMVYADSVSAASDTTYRFSDHADYLAAFRHSLDMLASLPCDILVTPHPLASDLFARMDGKAPLSNTNACLAYADAATRRLDKRLADETSNETR